MLRRSQQVDGWGQKTLQRLSMDLKNDYPQIKGFTVRNMQYMVQFFNEYNQDLTMVKDNRPLSKSAITKSVISQLEEYNFTLPVKHLDWTHNLVLIKQVKDIRARYWYMVQSIKTIGRHVISKKLLNLIITANTVLWQTIFQTPYLRRKQVKYRPCSKTRIYSIC